MAGTRKASQITPGAVWVSNHPGGSVSRVDPATNTSPSGPTGPSGPKGPVFAAEELWIRVPKLGAVVRIDAEANGMLATIPVADVGGVFTEGDRIFVFAGNRVSEIDPDTNSVVRDLAPEHPPTAFGLDTFWSVAGQDLPRLDWEKSSRSRTGECSRRLRCSPRIEIGEGSIWVAPFDQPTLVRVDPER